VPRLSPPIPADKSTNEDSKSESGAYPPEGRTPMVVATPTCAHRMVVRLALWPTPEDANATPSRGAGPLRRRVRLPAKNSQVTQPRPWSSSRAAGWRSSIRSVKLPVAGGTQGAGGGWANQRPGLGWAGLVPESRTGPGAPGAVEEDGDDHSDRGQLGGHPSSNRPVGRGSTTEGGPVRRESPRTDESEKPAAMRNGACELGAVFLKPRPTDHSSANGFHLARGTGPPYTASCPTPRRPNPGTTCRSTGVQQTGWT